MPGGTQASITLKECIYMYSERAKQSDAEFIRLWRIAFSGFEQFGFNAIWEPKVYRLAVDSQTMTADIPAEVLNWCKIGQFNSLGELQSLRFNPQLTTFHSGLPSRITDITPEIQDWENAFWSNVWFDNFNYFTGGNSGSFVNPTLALGSRLIQYGEFNVDWDERKIVLNTDYQFPHVILQAIVAPELDDDYSIPVQFRMAMIAWLGWQDIAYLPATNHVNNNTIDMRKAQFGHQLRLAKRMWKPIRLTEVYQELVEAQNLGIKP